MIVVDTLCNKRYFRRLEDKYDIRFGVSDRFLLRDRLREVLYFEDFGVYVLAHLREMGYYTEKIRAALEGRALRERNTTAEKIEIYFKKK